MDDIENYCFQIYMLQGMSDLGSIRGNYDTISILRGVATPSQNYVTNRRVIWMPPDGVL